MAFSWNVDPRRLRLLRLSHLDGWYGGGKDGLRFAEAGICPVSCGWRRGRLLRNSKGFFAISKVGSQGGLPEG